MIKKTTNINARLGACEIMLLKSEAKSKFICEKLAYALEHGSVMIDYMELQKFLKKQKVKKKRG